MRATRPSPGPLSATCSTTAAHRAPPTASWTARRLLWDAKASVDLESSEPDILALYGRLGEGTLARAHALSGDRIAIAADLGSSAGFDYAVAAFAETYADQNDRDAALAQAVAAHEVVSAPVG